MGRGDQVIRQPESYGIWLHVHANAYNDLRPAVNQWFLDTVPETSKESLAALIRKLPLLSSSHREFTVQARSPDRIDDGPNAICMCCKGPTRRVRDMLDAGDVWA
jgi:hypothetical protein